jgi:hypothetical protein
VSTLKSRSDQRPLLTFRKPAALVVLLAVSVAQVEAQTPKTASFTMSPLTIVGVPAATASLNMTPALAIVGVPAATASLNMTPALAIVGVPPATASLNMTRLILVGSPR